MHHKRTRRLAITLYTLIALSLGVAVFAAGASAAGISSYATTVHSKPGGIVHRNSGKLDPTVKSFDKLSVKLDGRAVPYSELRNCEADLTSRRVLITVDTCGRRIRVTVASTGTTSRIVKVALWNDTDTKNETKVRFR